MSEFPKQTTAQQDPTLTINETRSGFRDVDLEDPELVEQLVQNGELFRRKIEPVKGFRDPQKEEQIDTIVNDVVESSQPARPGEHKIITGSRGEEFVFTNAKFDSMYELNEEGEAIPRERFVMAMQNPYGEPIRIEAPWSTPDNKQYQDGTAEAMLTFGLDDNGELTSDRYLIGDREMLLANYDPVEGEEK